MYGKPEDAPSPFDPSCWYQSSDYLYGVDLYNFSFYWEAHEAWEGIWKTTERVDRPGRYLQGLIQVAAALLKRGQGITRGMRSLGRAGMEKLREAGRNDPVYCGLDLREYLSRMEKILDDASPLQQPVEPTLRLIIHLQNHKSLGP